VYNNCILFTATKRNSCYRLHGSPTPQLNKQMHGQMTAVICGLPHYRLNSHAIPHSCLHLPQVLYEFSPDIYSLIKQLLKT